MEYLVFDMDGTIADLYGVENWLDKLKHEDASPYKVAKPLVNMSTLRELFGALQAKGYKIVINTWLSKDSTMEYDNLVKKAKYEWLLFNALPYDHLHMVRYGTTKAKPMSKYFKPGDSAILFDDNEKVRNGWHLGKVIDPTTCNLLEVLKNLL